MDILLQQIINGLVQGSVYALVALGYTMVYGILGLINFAHGEVVMVGAMVALVAIKLLLATALSPVLVLLLSQVLQYDGNTDSGNQRRKTRCIAQGAVGDALDAVAQRHAD